ncbi:MAG: cytochrome c biogenesis protein CcsA [Herpetosiphonaceae bacterium]|nr:cytochrome c biogenesis protein CcsA [Herpetosiphonaceae bacterium]
MQMYYLGIALLLIAVGAGALSALLFVYSVRGRTPVTPIVGSGMEIAGVVAFVLLMLSLAALWPEAAHLVGPGLVIGAILAAVSSAVMYIRVTCGHTLSLPWARRGVYLATTLACTSAVLLLTLFLLHRYDIRYVYDYSSEDLELRFRIAAIWAGQPGSLVVWALVGLLVAPSLIRRTRAFEPYVLTLLMSLQAVLLVFMLIRNPFAATLGPTNLPITPADGRGLNEQLHNVWMVIHPPTLFTSYGLLGVAFCFAVAGLWRRDYDGWVRLALPWMLAGWAILGLALTMGGYWAYESLGWGGYWGWDPVENSSLVPWLTGAALVHGLVLQKAHGGMRRTNFFLAILTYGLVFYASFLTRSGVLANFSVHSFVEEGLKGTMLTSLTIILLGSTALFIWRWRDVPRKPLSESLLSRDAAFILLIMAFVSLAVVIGLGTSMPWISSLKGLGYGLQHFFGQAFTLDDGTALNPTNKPFSDGRFSFTADFFKRTTPPLAVILVMLISVGPLFGWRDSNRQKLVQTIRWPGFVAIGLTAGAVVLGVRSLMALTYILFAIFAIGTNGIIIVRTLRSGWLRIGGYLAHVGMGLLLLGVIGSYAYSSDDLKMTIAQGTTQNAFGHSFTYWGEEKLPSGKTALRFEVDQGQAGHFVARPELYFNQRMGATMQTPAIKRSAWQDLYISPAGSLAADDPNAATLGKGQAGVVGPYQIKFKDFQIDNHADTTGIAEVGAAVVITDTRTSTVRTLVPKMRVDANQKTVVAMPLELGNGYKLTLANFSPNPQDAQAILRIEGLNLPLVPARAIIEVSTKPAIGLVWTGSLMMFFGALLAWLRRRQELAAVEVAARDGARRRVGGVLPGWLGSLR